MVRTRGSSAFQQHFPLFHALIAGDMAGVAAHCTPQETAKCGPGNLSVLMLALLLDRDALVPLLIAAEAPLDATITDNSSNPEVKKWLAVAQLADKAVLHRALAAGASALDMAILLGKGSQAKALVVAGASLQPLLVGYGFGGWYGNSALYASRLLRAEMEAFALTHYSGSELSGVPALLLGQLARLRIVDGQLDACLDALQAAAQRSVQLGSADACVIIHRAAYEDSVAITMHMAQHSPGSVWDLLENPLYWKTAVPAALFPHLAQQFQEGKLLRPPHGTVLPLVDEALQADQPSAALMVLQALAQQTRQAGQTYTLLLSPEDAVTVLCRAAAKGFTEVVLQLIKEGCDVWPLIAPTPSSYYSRFPKIHAAVAAVFFPILVQGYADGWLKLDNCEELELVLYRATLCGQPTCCLALLRLAAARQSLLDEKGASTVLRAAAEQGHPEVVLHLLQQHGSRLLWELWGPSCSTHESVVHVVLLHMRWWLAAGALQLNRSQLGLVARQAAGPQHCVAEALIAFLQASAQRQICPTSDDTYNVLRNCVHAAASLDTAKQFLALGAAQDITQLSGLVCEAATKGLAAVLEWLLGLGAAVDTKLVINTVRSGACACLDLLLRLGPLPVDLSRVWRDGEWRRSYTCPVLCRLHESRFMGDADKRGFRCLEALLAAGHRPTIYCGLVNPAGEQPVHMHAYDPLKERPRDFPRDESHRWIWMALDPAGWGPATHEKPLVVCRWMWMALDPAGWSPATHQAHPAQLKGAFQAVLLAAARGSNWRCEQAHAKGSTSCKSQRLAAAGSPATQDSSPSGSAALLARLPTELLLHVLHLAACPLSTRLAAPCDT